MSGMVYMYKSKKNICCDVKYVCMCVCVYVCVFVCLGVSCGVRECVATGVSVTVLLLLVSRLVEG